MVEPLAERLRAIGDQVPAALRMPLAAVLEKALTTYTRFPLWPVAELPRRGLAALGASEPVILAATAAAVLFHAAADVIDDAEDGELEQNPAWQGWSWPTGVNAGLACLFASQRAFAAVDAPERARFGWLCALAAAGARLTAGQQADLAATHDAPYGEAELRSVTTEKAGASWGFLASIAPIWAGEDPAPFQRFGEALGQLYQLASDLAPYQADRPHGDLALGKLTLPLYHAREVDPEGWAELGPFPLDEEAQLALARRVRATGALFYGQMRVEVLKTEAHEALAGVSSASARTAYAPLIDEIKPTTLARSGA